MHVEADSGSAPGAATVGPLVYAIVTVTAVLLQLLRAARRVYPLDEDPIYYRLTAEALARGRGFVSDVSFMWLVAPNSAQSHPSHDHWQPLTSVLSAPFVLISDQLWVGVIPMALLTGAAAAVFLWLGLRSLDSPALAIGAVLILLSDETAGRYFSSVESIPAYVLFLLLAAIAYSNSEHSRPFGPWPLLLGVFSALAALSRSDAMTLFGIAGVSTYSFARLRRRPVPSFSALMSSALAFGCVMAPWWVRNFLVFGSPMPPASRAAPWLLAWSDVLTYQPMDWKARYWEHAAANPGAVVLTKLSGLWFELEQVISGPGGRWLAPLVVLGLVPLLRRRSSVLAFLAAFAVALVATYGLLMDWGPAVGGGYRSRVATLPLMTLALVAGAETLVRFATRWVTAAPTKRVFEVLVLIGALALLGLRVDGITKSPIEGAGTKKIFDAVTSALSDVGVPEDAVIITNEPLRIAWSTRRPTLVVPNDGVGALCEVARRYDARWLVLFPFGWHFERYASEPVRALATHQSSGPELTTIVWSSWFHLIEIGCGRGAPVERR